MDGQRNWKWLRTVANKTLRGDSLRKTGKDWTDKQKVSRDFSGLQVGLERKPGAETEEGTEPKGSKQMCPPTIRFFPLIWHRAQALTLITS